MIKKLIIVTSVLFGTLPMSAEPADTYRVSCVKLSQSTECTDSFSETLRIDWSATCGEISINAIAVCSSTPGDSIGQIATNGLETNSGGNDTVDANTYCWCRMISPAVSKWVLARPAESAATCTSMCSRYCAGYMESYPDFRAGMFSTLMEI